MANLASMKACSWCNGSSILNIGLGYFRDSDYDFSPYTYRGIPVCGGCGGLGYQSDDAEFKETTKKIMELRFKYCPTDGLPEPPEIIRYQALMEMERLVKGLVDKYGATEGCLADMINKGLLSFGAPSLKLESEAMIEALKSYEQTDVELEASREALLAYYSGEIQKGHELYQKTVEQYPNRGENIHDFAGMIMIFERKPELALPLFIKAIEVTPKALHNYHAAQCFYFLKRNKEALELLDKAEEMADFDDVKESIYELRQIIAKA